MTPMQGVLNGLKALRFAPTLRAPAAALTPSPRALRGSSHGAGGAPCPTDRTFTVGALCLEWAKSSKVSPMCPV